ncbi:12732_t:CDS:2 [Funneliformis mosseae]|uniref:12732_t:CDS:1 n=1 Tax=Funneliformis mosseae TaxID=27381 RepID=A0A9N9F8M2_FUNMO|nr:12732_t:CDS:2 [Funneliformis mosseae]
MPAFDLKTDLLIKEFMQGEGKNSRKPYAELSRRIPKFSSKQISHRWNYKINPRVTNGPFTQEEKEFIYNWVSKNTKASDNISWANCQTAMEMKFNKFRSANRIQGIWITHLKHLERINRQNVKNFKPPFILPKVSHVNPTIVISKAPTLRLRPPHLPTLIPDFQPEMYIPKMMPLF